MSNLIIRPRNKAIGFQSDSQTGESIITLGVSPESIIIPNKQIELGFDLFAEWEDGIWGPVDDVYDYGEIIPD